MSTIYSDLDYDEYLAHYGVKGMKWRPEGQRGLPYDAKNAASEIRDAYKGGDSGYGSLRKFTTDRHARGVVNRAAKVGEKAQLIKDASEEIQVSAKGGDFGYGSVQSLVKSDKLARDIVNAAAYAGAQKKKIDRHLSRAFAKYVRR